MNSLIAILMSLTLPIITKALGLDVPSFSEQLISQPHVNATLSVPVDLGAGHQYVLKGAYGNVKLPSIPVLMNALDGLADLAHLDSKSRIRGYHVPTVPNYRDIDIGIHPPWPETDFEAQYAVYGLYCVIYNMITTKTFLNSTFGLGQDGMNWVTIVINKRSKSATIPEAEVNLASTSENGNLSLVANTNSTAENDDRGLQYFFKLLDEQIAPQDVFITIMATLKNVAQEEDEEIVDPFRSGALGFTIRFQSLPLRKPRTAPPYLTYKYLIDTIKHIPGYMIKERKFAALMIVISFGKEVIGEAVLEKGTPEVPELDFANNNVSIA